ncbi:hypothetical protein CPR19092_LGOLGGFK_00617 [Companilactobacillus paralimentarius]|jgi:hypothetical protein
MPTTGIFSVITVDKLILLVKFPFGTYLGELWKKAKIILPV